MIVNTTGKLAIDYHASERIDGQKAWCELSYPGHKKGCPNYGKSCPLPRVKTYFDLTKPHWFAIVKFNLEFHAIKMKYFHPGWSERQCRCVLYWQGSVRKLLDKECVSFINGRNLIWHKIPEAMGVDVMLTMKNIGLYIETKPKIIVRKIALIGVPCD